MRAARVAAGAATAAGTLHAAPAAAPVLPPLARALRIPLRVDAPGVVLTFDDGPHPRGTPAVLDLLAQAGAPAVFFLAGEQVERNPGLAGEIVAAGHQVGLHCHRHRNQLRLGPGQIAEDMARGAAAIAAATGATPRLFRPPYGIFSAGGLALARRRHRTLLWSRWGHDWRRRAAPRSIAREVAQGARPGDVLLLHDSDAYSAPGSWRNTAAALPLVLEELDRSGTAVVAVP